MRLLLALLLLAACVPGPRPPDVPDPVELGPVAIDTLTMACDLDEEQWALGVVATSWSGNGTLWMTADAAYVEEHPVPSVLAAEDGSFDELGVDLSIEADFRDVEPGRSTAFLCAEDPAWLFVVYDREGAVADCRVVGPDVWDRVDPELGVPGCEVVWGGE